jgi:hypothetical protein
VVTYGEPTARARQAPRSHSCNRTETSLGAPRE